MNGRARPEPQDEARPPAVDLAASARAGQAVPDVAARAAARLAAAARADVEERRWTGRAGLGLWALASALAAGIAHIGSILLMPVVAPNDAFSRIERLAPLGALTLIAPAGPGRELAPFEDPAMVSAVCRFDLSQGALRVRAPISGDDFVSLTARTRDNVSFYALTDRSAVRGAIEFLVVTASQRDALEEADGEEGSTETRVTSPTMEGYVFLRALAASPLQMSEAQALLRAAQCDIEPM
jgi:uncharacterized membrane protein